MPVKYTVESLKEEAKPNTNAFEGRLALQTQRLEKVMARNKIYFRMMLFVDYLNDNGTKLKNIYCF